MKLLKRIAALFLAAILVIGCVATAWAVSVVVKYKIYVYTDEIVFYRYNYVDSTTPTIQNVRILADSDLGSGSALYHVKYVGGSTIAYCVQPGVKADDSNNYVEGANGAWYNLPASKQSAVALAMAMGYPSAEYGTAYDDTNDSNTIMAEKYAATQAVIWGIISEYIDAYAFYEWYNPFYYCVDTDQYPTFALWYDEILEAMREAITIPSFCESYASWCDPIELNYDAASGNYKGSVYDDNGVLSSFNFAKYSGSGITLSQSGNTLNITATAAAVQALNGATKTYSTTGSAVNVDADAAVLCYYDSTGTYQTLGTYTYDGLDPMLAYLKIMAVEAKSALEITKTDADTGAPLAGAGYKLYDASGTEVVSGVTDANGKLTFSDLTPGQYTYQEYLVPDGYILDSTKYAADLSSAGVTVQVSQTNTPVKASITVNKVNAAGAPLGGVTVLLESSADGGNTWSTVSEKSTGTDGTVLFDKLPIEPVYRLTEVSTVDGYTLMGDILYQGNLPENGVYDVTITAVNDVNLQLPFTGGAGFVVTATLSLLMLCMGYYFIKTKENY